MEDGTITLIGATTENPSFELNAALLSYDGVAHVGLTIDAGAVEDPAALGDCIRAAFHDVIGVGWSED